MWSPRISRSWHQVVFHSGPLRPAIAGSIAIPIAVQAGAVANHLLVDGGVVNPLPLDQAADCDILVGIDVNGDPTESLQQARLQAARRVVRRGADHDAFADRAHDGGLSARRLRAAACQLFGTMEFWRVREIVEHAAKDKDNFKRHLSRKVEQFIMRTDDTTRAGD